MSGYRVMLVDDEIWALKGLEKIVNWERYGFSIAAECRDGREALQRLEKEPIDVIFTDLSMDIMGGKEFVRALRERGYKTEVVIVSAYTDFEAAREGIRLGVFDYMLKPYHDQDIRSLLLRLEKHLKEKKHKELLLSIDRDTEFAPEQIREIRERIGEGYPYIFLRRKDMSSMDYEEQKNCLQRYAAGDMIPCRYASGIEGVLFSGNVAMESLLQDQERIGLSMTGEDLKNIRNMMLEAGLSNFLGIPFSSDTACRSMQSCIIHHLSKMLSLEEIADSAFLSKSYASSYFSKTTGMSLGEYQKKVHMFAACDQLHGTDRSVADIAADLGFDDPSYFSKVFKSEFGMMPKEYRKQKI